MEDDTLFIRLRWNHNHRPFVEIYAWWYRKLYMLDDIENYNWIMVTCTNKTRLVYVQGEVTVCHSLTESISELCANWRKRLLAAKVAGPSRHSTVPHVLCLWHSTVPQHCTTVPHVTTALDALAFLPMLGLLPGYCWINFSQWEQQRTRIFSAAA